MTAKHSPLTALIHAVLDGEASDAEKRELEMRLSADPAARAELEDWKRLFEALDAMPKEHAPEGLVAAITSAVPEAPGASAAASQRFAGRRVLGHTSAGISLRVPTRSVTMSEQSSRRTFANRKAWLGGGIAAAVAVVVTQLALDFPLSKDVVGTIVPAQRYRAAQNGTEQVQLGAPAGQAAPTGAAPDANRALAEKSAAESALHAERSQAQLTAEKAQTQMTAEKSQAQLTAERAQTQMKAERSQAQLTAERAQTQKTAERSQAQLTADRSQTQKTAERSQAQLTADRSQAQATAERMQTQMTAEKVQAERMQVEKVQAERIQAEKVQAERMKADRTTQQ